MSEPKTPAEIKAYMEKRRAQLFEGAGIDINKMQKMAADFMKQKDPIIAAAAMEKEKEDIQTYQNYTNMILSRTRINKQRQTKIPNSFERTPGSTDPINVLKEMREQTADLMKHTIGETTPIGNSSDLRAVVYDIKFIPPNEWSVHENVSPFVSSIIQRLPKQKSPVKLMAIKAFVPGTRFDVPPKQYPSVPGADQKDIDRTARMPTFYAIEQRAFEVPAAGDEIGIRFPDKYRLDAGVYTGQIFSKKNRGKAPPDLKNMFKGNSTKPLKGF
jgi:hypothetical protein